MRIERGDGEAISSVDLFLSRDEAAELRDALNQLLASFGEPHWHAHVADWDYTTEITVVADHEADEAHPPRGGTWQHGMATPRKPDEPG